MMKVWWDPSDGPEGGQVPTSGPWSSASGRQADGGESDTRRP